MHHRSYRINGRVFETSTTANGRYHVIDWFDDCYAHKLCGSKRKAAQARCENSSCLKQTIVELKRSPQFLIRKQTKGSLVNLAGKFI
jgi:hypothetical protein